MHPLDSMECPGCGATLPQTATGCECGYHFVMPNAPTTPAPGVVGGATFAQPPPNALGSDAIRAGRIGSTSSADGTFIGGLALGLICGCIGLAIAYVAKTGSKTKQGALVGFGVGLVIGAFMRFIAR